MSQNDIIISRDRTKALVLLIGLGLLLVYFMAGMVLILSFPHSLFLSGPGSIMDWLWIFLFLLVACRTLWHLLARQLFAPDPILLINAQGIAVGRLPGVFGEASISWEEISTLSISSFFFQASLCILPKDRKAYLARFPFWKRLNMGMFSWPGALKVIQFWTSVSVDEIVQQIGERYALELEENRIQLWR